MCAVRLIAGVIQMFHSDKIVFKTYIHYYSHILSKLSNESVEMIMVPKRSSSS